MVRAGGGRQDTHLLRGVGRWVVETSFCILRHRHPLQKYAPVVLRHSLGLWEPGPSFSDLQAMDHLTISGRQPAGHLAAQSGARRRALTQRPQNGRKRPSQRPGSATQGPGPGHRASQAPIPAGVFSASTGCEHHLLLTSLQSTSDNLAPSTKGKPYILSVRLPGQGRWARYRGSPGRKPNA